MNIIFNKIVCYKLFYRVFLAFFLIIFSNVTLAERAVGSLPHEESFDADNYADITWVNTHLGATHTWMPAEGWNGAGAARFTPPLVDQGYSGLGQFVSLNGSTGVNQLNVRFLIKHGSTWREFGRNSKVIIMNRFFDDGSQGDRPMIISREDDSQNWVTYGACDGTVCNYQGGGWWPDGTDDFRIGNAPLNREEEWISVEFEANASTGIINLYIYTRDGQLSGRYTSQSMARTGGMFKYIDIIGGYMDEGLQSDPNSYFMLDELKIDSQYIGPPAGFVVDGVPNPPSSLTAD